MIIQILLGFVVIVVAIIFLRNIASSGNLTLSDQLNGMGSSMMNACCLHRK